MAAVGVEHRGHPQALRHLRGDLHHADVITNLPLKLPQRLLDFIDQVLRVAIGLQHALQPLRTKQLFIRACGFGHAIGEQEQLVAGQHGQHPGRMVKRLGLQHPQRQMLRTERGTLPRGQGVQIAIGHSPAPHFKAAPQRADTDHVGAAEHVDRQDTFELGIHFTEHFAQPVAFGRHAVEHLSQGHRTNGCRQPVAGKVGQQQVGIARRRVGSKQQVAVEQGVRRLPILDIRGAQAALVGHAVKHRLGHPLLIEQIHIVPGDLVTLLQHGVLQAPQAIHDSDLGGQQHRVIRLEQHIITARLQGAGQCIGVIE